jgi:simple sugar transport system permease protein
LNSSFIIALFLLLFFFLLFRKSLPGYEMKMIGLNREFARYGGINVGLYTVTVMAASGALHGLGGSLFVLGTHHAAISGFTAGMGWNGLAVALIAKNKPAFIFPAAFLIAYLEAGARSALLGSDFSLQINMIIQSIIFFFITVTAFKKIPLKRRRKGGSHAL